MSTPQTYEKAIASSSSLFSSPESIKVYFEKVRTLAKAGSPYPVELDDVWPLCYAGKGVAVRVLQKQFIEGYDYQSINKKVKRETGATVTIVYSLSVSCMEYFVARKVRSVFEVYRQVFHHALDVTEQKAIGPDCSKAIAKLQKQIDRLTAIHEEYIKPRIVKQQEAESEWAEKRSKIFNRIDKRTKYGLGTSYDCALIEIRDMLREVYKLETVTWKDRYQREGEHWIDMMHRLGYGENVYNVVMIGMKGE